MADIDQKYFPTLDGLRAVCISLVIFQHVPRAAHDFLNRVPGWLGVDMFFVMSGFLITTLSLREEAANGKIDLSAFYIRRFFRIVPFTLLSSGFMSCSRRATICAGNRWYAFSPTMLSL